MRRNGPRTARPRGERLGLDPHRASRADVLHDANGRLGGVLAGIEENFFQREIADASFRFQSEVEAGDRVIVGVNRFEDPNEREIEILKIDAALEQKQIDRVQALRARRDSATVESALARLKQDAAGADTNLMPAIVDASRAYVTMGEMCDALRETWGVWRETPVF